MNNKSVSTATIGYMCLALALWMISMPAAGWYDRMYAAGPGTMAALGALLTIMGILAFVHGRALDSIIFFGGSGLFWADYLSHAIPIPSGAAPSSYGGWAAFVWAVFFCWVWVGSFKAGLQRWLFLLGLWLSLLALAIAGWGNGAHVFIRIGGYIGLATAVLAAITSAIEVICHGLSSGNPNHDGRTASAAHAATGGTA